MGRIRILSDRVANQIAAGEVVERPASVCKELIENSLDAGASQLRVELKAGGRSLVKVNDNGSGMNRDDAMLAFERHATSKLRTADDLLAIATLGFRGEALPSIASVSRLLLETRSADEKSGTGVEIDGGRIRDVRDAALACGTTLAVRNLFFNVPARRKFLRTEKTELAHALRTVTHYSLAHLDKAFQMRNEHGTLLNVTPVATLRERVYQVFGGELLERLVELEPASGSGGEEGGEGLGLTGFVSEPQAQRTNRNSYHIFVNRRMVRDGLIQKAVGAAYENLMPHGVYPFALLFLDIPPGEVDVNVHPAKTEIRFRNPSRVFEFIRDTIRARLVVAKPASPLPQPRQIDQRGYGSVVHSIVGPGAAAPAPAGAVSPASPQLPFPAAGPVRSRPWSAIDLPASLSSHPESLPSSVARHDLGHSREPLVDRAPSSLGSLGRLDLLGQLHNSFIVAAGEDGIWIIDQHVAHERILFEKVLAERLQSRREMQGLLSPVVLTLTPDRMVAYEELADEFHANGFEIEPFGGRTVAVKAVPSELPALQVESLIHDLLDPPNQNGARPGLGHLRKRMAATIACHAAIKINMRLSEEKMRWLLEELARSDCPMSCPHGRPVALQYGTRDILKAFHRV